MVKLTIKKAVSGWKTFAFPAFLLFLSSCGIFSTRPSETPPPDLKLTDTLNFSAIMGGTGQKFTQPQLSRFEDLFLDTAQVYYDFNSDWYSRNQLIQRLQQILVQYANIHIKWATGTVKRSADTDTMYLSGLKYYIDTSGVPLDSGSSNFIVVNKLNWIIYQWTDVPARGGKSFFAL